MSELVQFVTAKEIYEMRQKYFKIPTGVKALDTLLGGGIEQGAITEFYGEYRTGKTQICLQLLVKTTFPKNQGGLGANAAFVDTEGTFRPERLLQIAESMNTDPKYNPSTILNQILVGKALSTDEQIDIVKQLLERAKQDNIKLIVIDSLTNHFRAEFIGQEHLVERQQKLNKHMHQLNAIANSTEAIAIVVTNQVLANISGIGEQELVAVGGHIVAHGSTHRIELSEKNVAVMNTRILQAKIIDSPNLPGATAEYQIIDRGVADLSF